tara:strand:- start:241 stop:567 length:327 start_codon:yes stop_codon:yes gene_type:complete
MKIFSVLLFFPLISFTGESVKADVNVNGYYRSNGTFVQPHRRSSPNNSLYDNYSYPGNYNPNSGSYTPSYTPSYSPPSYSAPTKKKTYGGYQNNNSGTCRDIYLAGIC